MKTLIERFPEKLADCAICGHGVYTHPVKQTDPARPGKTRVICVFCDFDLMVAENEAAPDITSITGSAEGDALMYGEDTDSPEVEYIPFEDDGGEWDS